jgi:hypothetical protein
MGLDARAGSGNDAIPRSDRLAESRYSIVNMPEISSKVADERHDAFPLVDGSQGTVYDIKDILACSALLRAFNIILPL